MSTRELTLVKDLRNDPERYFDHPSPLALDTFLKGYEQGERGMIDALGIMNDKLQAQYSGHICRGTGMLLYLVTQNELEGYYRYVDLLEEAVGLSVVHGPATLSFVQILDVLDVRAPVLLGSWDVRDLRIFLLGLHRALADGGGSPEQDILLLNQFEIALQAQLNLLARWDKLLFCQDGGAGRSAALFAKSMRRFLQGETPIGQWEPHKIT